MDEKEERRSYMRYNSISDSIEMTVEELCSRAFSIKDIDNRRGSSVGGVRASDRQKIYDRLHSLFGMRYYDSVELSNTVKLGDIYFCVEGRADGIICVDGQYTVDSIRIKGRGAFDSGSQAYRAATLYCYAYFVCRAKNVDTVRIRTVLYDTEENELEFSERAASLDELRRVYMDLICRVEWRAKILRDRFKDRLPTAATAVFPYSTLRDSQTEMIKECYRDIKHGKRLFCQAPTGIGKTVSTLFPSAKCVGEGYADKVFYLTSKQSIRREALSAMSKMNAAGMKLRATVIYSREAMCQNGMAKLRGGRLSSNCNPEMCPYAKGYYDRAEKAIAELIAGADIFDNKDLIDCAMKHKICPYELSLDLSELCDVVICDYNYVFSPTVYLKRYFDCRGDDAEKYIFLVDEAHNLPDRARDMFSSSLNASDFAYLAELLEENSPLHSACTSMQGSFERLAALCRDSARVMADGTTVGFSVSRSMPDRFIGELDDFSRKLDAFLRRRDDSQVYFAAEELAFKIYEFKKTADGYDRQYVTYVHQNGAEISVLLYCLDPSARLSELLSRAHASVLFSATLTPTEYFADILGGDKNTVSVSFPSPFHKENLCVAAVDTISTRYEDRDGSYKKIASCIAALASSKSGNYMIYFPSYDYMEQVRRIFTAKYPKVRTLVQKRNMSVAEKEAFISALQDDGKTRIGFCVLGGSFSEGIDLPGGRLIGVMVVGVGLPGLSSENNIIRDYYEDKCGEGYDYAYTYPGMNGVLQAVGRVIRTENDVGIAVLIDDRYAEPKYRSMFLQDWGSVQYAGNARSLAEIARIFWEKHKKQ
jgi:Rad3-related DNA helicase